ncbi:MAG: hypothetical protein RL318_822 [Fibrobacterota bacterium]|jgi:uncharacterized membrane protein YbaN (DUF454 family)
MRFSGLRKLFWNLAGITLLGTGIAGIVLPLLPTVPFVLAAAFCFSKGSPRLESWLLSHPRFGPWIRDWRAHHRVPRVAKIAASVTMFASCSLSSIYLALPWILAPWISCALVAAWLWTRPTRI